MIQFSRQYSSSCLSILYWIINNFETCGCVAPKQHKKMKSISGGKRDLWNTEICVTAKEKPTYSNRQIADVVRCMFCWNRMNFFVEINLFTRYYCSFSIVYSETQEIIYWIKRCAGTLGWSAAGINVHRNGKPKNHYTNLINSFTNR